MPGPGFDAQNEKNKKVGCLLGVGLCERTSDTEVNSNLSLCSQGAVKRKYKGGTSDWAQSRSAVCWLLQGQVKGMGVAD